MWLSLRDPILRWIEALAVSALQLLRVLLSLRCTLRLHVMYGTAADKRETGTEDHATVWLIRVGRTPSDNIEHFDLSLNSSAARMAITPNSRPQPGRDFHHVTGTNVLA
jgi:hypothetical protein